MRRSPQLGPLLVSALAAACGGGTSPLVARAPDRATLEAALTPAAAEGLTAAGQFAALADAQPEPYPQITGEAAARIALAAARQFGPFVLSDLEATRGGPVTLDQLRVDAVYYGATPYEAVPADAHPSTRKYYGPYYLIVLTDAAGSPTLIAPVSARNTDITFAKDGTLLLPPVGGSAFVLQAVPRRLATLVVTPERAAVEAAARTGRRVAAVPELVLPRAGESKVKARWRVRLEAPAEAVVGGLAGSRRVLSELYLGLHGDFWAPATAQPPAAPIDEYIPGRSLARKTMTPVVFDRVDFRP